MGTVLFVYAHPDDESFGIAGTALELAAVGYLRPAVDRSGAQPVDGDLLGSLA